MIFDGQFPIGFFDIFQRGILADLQYFVRIKLFLHLLRIVLPEEILLGLVFQLILFVKPLKNRVWVITVLGLFMLVFPWLIFDIDPQCGCGQSSWEGEEGIVEVEQWSEVKSLHIVFDVFFNYKPFNFGWIYILDQIATVLESIQRHIQVLSYTTELRRRSRGRELLWKGNRRS